MQIPFLRKPFDHINPNSREHLTFRTARWLVTFGLAAAASFTWVQGATVYQFQQGLNGYDGALDTQIRGGSPDREDGAVALLSIDGSDGGGANHIFPR